VWRASSGYSPEPSAEVNVTLQRNPTIYSAKEYKKKRRSKAFLKRVMEQPKVWLKE